MGKRQQKILIIDIKNESELFAEAKELFVRLDKNLPVKGPVYRLYFENLVTLWRTLTPKRTELMQLLRKQGPMSIRKLSIKLKRDYKNVHTDIQELTAVDLIRQIKDDLFEVPWDIIDLKIQLAA